MKSESKNYFLIFFQFSTGRNQCNLDFVYFSPKLNFLVTCDSTLVAIVNDSTWVTYSKWLNLTRDSWLDFCDSFLTLEHTDKQLNLQSKTILTKSMIFNFTCCYQNCFENAIKPLLVFQSIHLQFVNPCSQISIIFMK